MIENITELPDGSYSVNPEEHVQDVLDELELPYTEEQEDEMRNKLMSELTYEAFPSIPREGQRFRAYGMNVIVSKMSHNRILRLKVRKLPAEDAAAAKGGE